jgi:hypothetical protein
MYLFLFYLFLMSSSYIPHIPHIFFICSSCIYSSCIYSSCVYSSCIYSSCIYSSCVYSSCIYSSYIPHISLMYSSSIPLKFIIFPQMFLKWDHWRFRMISLPGVVRNLKSTHYPSINSYIPPTKCLEFTNLVGCLCPPLQHSPVWKNELQPNALNSPTLWGVCVPLCSIHQSERMSFN